MHNDMNPVMAFVFFVVGLVIYFLPAIIASSRKHNNSSAIFVTTLLFGWSCLGWGAAMIWAHSDNIRKD